MMSKLSWQTKLMGLIVLVLGALLLFQLFYVIPYLRNREVERTQGHQEEIAHNIALLLDTKLRQGEKDLTQMAERAEFRNMDLVNQTQTMIWYRELIPQLSSLFALDAEGWFVSGTAKDLTVYQTQSYADADFFAVPFEQGQVYLSSPRSYFEGTLVGASVSVPIESDAGERVGVLIGGVWLNELIEYVKDYSLGEGTVAYAVDSEGTVFAHSGMDLFALEEGPLSLDFSDRLLVQAIMAGEMGGSREYDRQGTPYFGSYVTLEPSGWGVVVETPMSAILAESSLLAGRLLSVNIVLFAIALGVTLVFARQITVEQRRAAEALKEYSERLEEMVEQRTNEARESETKYRNLTESLDELIYRADPETFVATYVNPAVEGIYDYTVEEWLADPTLWESAIHPDDQERVFAEFTEIQREIESAVVEYRIIRKDKTVRWVEDHVSWEKDQHGNAVSMTGVLYDITERKRDEKELRKHRQHLEELVEERTAELKRINEQLEAEVAVRGQAEETLAQRVEELQRFNRLAVGRELRMIELKRQINALSEQLGKEPPYDLSLLE